jgi:acetyltransferase-like isoleucine patch superfamily enzyme
MRRLAKSILAVLISVLPAPVDPAHAGPGLHLRWRLGWLKGHWFRTYQSVRTVLGGTSLQAGRRLVIQGSLRLRGPGRVVLGDDVIVDAKTDIFTHSSEAVVTIGDRGFVNGTRFGCVRAIRIGTDAILADARIMDTDFHSIHRDRRRKSAPIQVAPVVIGENVWIAAGAAVLRGVTIGDDSVVAFGSVVTKDVPPGTIVGGNPARELGPVPESISPAI